MRRHRTPPSALGEAAVWEPGEAHETRSPTGLVGDDRRGRPRHRRTGRAGRPAATPDAGPRSSPLPRSRSGGTLQPPPVRNPGDLPPPAARPPSRQPRPAQGGGTLQPHRSDPATPATRQPDRPSRQPVARHRVRRHLAAPPAGAPRTVRHSSDSPIAGDSPTSAQGGGTLATRTGPNPAICRHRTARPAESDSPAAPRVAAPCSRTGPSLSDLPRTDSPTRRTAARPAEGGGTLRRARLKRDLPPPAARPPPTARGPPGPRRAHTCVARTFAESSFGPSGVPP